jgi:hypothetical protein
VSQESDRRAWFQFFLNAVPKARQNHPLSAPGTFGAKNVDFQFFDPPNMQRIGLALVCCAALVASVAVAADAPTFTAIDFFTGKYVNT